MPESVAYTSLPNDGSATMDALGSASISTSSSRRYPMQESQLELWLASQQSPEASCAYNELCSLELEGPLDLIALRGAVGQLTERHAALRSVFSPDGESVVVQPESVAIDWQILDWSGDHADRSLARYEGLIQTEGQTPFDLANGPLVRWRLQLLGPDKHRLTIIAHHLVLDGWSMGIVYKELGQLYNLQLGLGEALPAAPDYTDYVERLTQRAESADGREEWEYWKKQFTDGGPLLDLPTHASRPTPRSYRAARLEHRLPAELVQRLRVVFGKHGGSLFQGLLTAFQVFIGRLSGCTDVVVGVPSAGQSLLQLEGLVGHCVHTLPVRCQVNLNHNFATQLASTRSQLLDAMQHGGVSLGSLVRQLAIRREASRPPLCSVLFNLDPALSIDPNDYHRLKVELRVEPRCSEHFEWFVSGLLEHDQSITFQIQYSSALFTPDRMAEYWSGFECFLQSLADSPEERLGDLPIMSLAERQRMLVDWNQTDLNVPWESRLPDLIAEAVTRFPDRIAVGQREVQITYRQLWEQSDQLAQQLNGHGVEPGDLIGVATARTPQLLVQLLAIHKAGCAYLPLDSRQPDQRLQQLCQDAQPRCILASSQLTPRLEQLGWPAIDVERFTLESPPAASSNPPPIGKSTDAAYVLFTSGSTGVPKGVVVSHQSVVNFLLAMRDRLNYRPSLRWLAVTHLSFDIATLELFLPLVSGGSVELADADSVRDGERLRELLCGGDIGWLQATPALWRLLVVSGWKGTPRLIGMCGGETFPTDLAAPLLAGCDQVWNLYGPTETTVWSTAYRLTPQSKRPLIGRPIGNTQLYVLDAEQRELPVGSVGELYIGGAGVAQGYLNRPELTQERFIDNRYFDPFAAYSTNRLYRTGDLVRYLPDGNLEFIGRNDTQVKLRGHRIELAEIARHLEGHPAVTQAVVVAEQTAPDDPHLVAYVRCHDNRPPHPQAVAGLSSGEADRASKAELLVSELRRHLQQLLPSYMLPRHVVPIDQWPLTPNGKIDLGRLSPPPSPNLPPATRSPAGGMSHHDGSVPETSPARLNDGELSPAETLLADTWQQFLRIPIRDRQANFFDLGGHSLLVVQVIQKIQQKTGIRLSPQDFLTGSLEQLAAQLDGSSHTSLRKASASPIDARPEPTAWARLKGFWNA
jgi:amino acid adenylation domain-containing protein